jgi:hypothetical protein
MYLLAFALTAMLMCRNIASADVRYTLTMTMAANDTSSANHPPQGQATPGIAMTTMVQGSNERKETSFAMGQMTMHQVTITRCSDRQVITVNDMAKIYKVDSLDAVAPTIVPETNKNPFMRTRPEQSGEGQSTTTISVQDLGKETVNGITDAHHSIMTMTQVSTGCETSSSNMKLEIWTAPIKIGFDCPEKYPTATAPRSVTTAGGCHMSYTFKGDVGDMRNVMTGMIVKELIYNDGKLIMTGDLKDYSTNPLDSALFNAPAGYKLVSSADYDHMVQQAMMQQFMNGHGNGQDTGQPPSTDTGAAGAGNNTTGGDTTNTDNGTTTTTPPPATNPPPKKKHGFSFPGGIPNPF